jgi:hypothetical protein
MDLEKLNSIFLGNSEFVKYKFDKFIEYSNKEKILTSEKLKDWLKDKNIKTGLELNKNYSNFINFIFSLYTEDTNVSKLAVHLLKKKKITLKDVIKNKKNSDYLFDIWMDDIKEEKIFYTRNADEDSKKTC